MSTISLLPDNRTTLETSLEKTLSDHLLNIESPYPQLWSPADISAALLPYLAHAKGVADWGDDTEQAKRQTVQDIWPMQRQAGTRLAVKRAVDALGFDADVVRGDQPYYLKIDLWRGDVGTVEPDIMARAKRRINAVKSERDAIAVTLNVSADTDLRVGMAASAVIEAQAGTEGEEQTQADLSVALGAGALVSVSSSSAVEQLRTDIQMSVALAAGSQLLLTVTECY